MRFQAAVQGVMVHLRGQVVSVDMFGGLIAARETSSESDSKFNADSESVKPN
jgi:hypothetical protein